MAMDTKTLNMDTTEKQRAQPAAGPAFSSAALVRATAHELSGTPPAVVVNS